MAGILIHLIGFPGVGKLTVAREIVRLGGYHLVDNHKINNPIFSIIGADGISPLPEGIWECTRRIWDVVYDAMENLAPADFDFVCTNVLLESPEDHLHSQKLQAVAARRGGIYVPVFLTCELEENRRRIVAEERRAHFKGRDPGTLDKLRNVGLAELGDLPYRIDLDVTATAPAEAARRILNRVGGWL